MNAAPKIDEDLRRRELAQIAAELELLGRRQSTDSALTLLERLRSDIEHIRGELIR